jgi:hypothetical protein
MAVFESEDIKAVTTVYNGLYMEWVASTAEKRPFHMSPPEMHSFLPALVSEIKVQSMSKEEYHKQSNQYYQQMQKSGLSGVMNQNFNKGY